MLTEPDKIDQSGGMQDPRIQERLLLSLPTGVLLLSLARLLPYFFPCHLSLAECPEETTNLVAVQ